MGKGSEGIAASSCDSEDNGLGSCKAHHVSSSPQEDCGVSAGEVGEVESRKEGCLVNAPMTACRSLPRCNRELLPD
jgi:hypothetical protein